MYIILNCKFPRHSGNNEIIEHTVQNADNLVNYKQMKFIYIGLYNQSNLTIGMIFTSSVGNDEWLFMILVLEGLDQPSKVPT